jgi:hypothetical protein
MTAFGKCNGGGRRSAPRRTAPLIVVCSSVTASYRATLVDLSATGARLSCSLLPGKGEELLLNMERIRTFATVIWLSGQEFGLAFEEALKPDEVDLLLSLGSKANGLGAEMRAALDIWMAGSPR